MIRRMSWFAVLAALGGLSACGNLGSRFVKAENVSAKGGLIQIAATDNAQLAGTALAIPLGALKNDTTITVDLANTALLSPDLAAGPTVEWGPAGTQFASAAEMQLPYAADSQDEIFIQVEEANGERFEIDPSALALDVAHKLVRFRVNGFTRFQAGARRQCSSSVKCASGKTCHAGRCAVSCTSNSQCSTKQTCVSGACQSEGTLCVTNSQCLTNQACTNNHCVTFEPLDGGPAGEGGHGGALDGGKAPVCASNLDCSSNEVCLAQLCVTQNCTTNAQCGLGSACIGHQCVPVEDGGAPDLDGGIDLDAGAGDGGLGAHCINNAQCGEAWYCGTDYQCHPINCSVRNGDAGVSCVDGGQADAGDPTDGGPAEDGGQPDGGDLDAGEAPDAGVLVSCRVDFDCHDAQHCVDRVCR